MKCDLGFDGYWTGDVPYRCDYCGRIFNIRFDDQDEAFDYMEHQRQLKAAGWTHTKLNGKYMDFCSKPCLSRYISRKH